MTWIIFVHDCYKCNVTIFQNETMEIAVAVAPKLPVNSSIDKYVSLLAHQPVSPWNFRERSLTLISLFLSQDMLEVFEAIQGKFQQIRLLTRRQKDHLKRFHGGNDTSNGNTVVYKMPNIACSVKSWT